MQNYPNDADGAVLTDLASRGVNMSQPLLIEFPVAVPNESTAENCFKVMTKTGYDSTVEYDEGEPDFDPNVDDADEFGPAWTVYAHVRMVPEYSEIIRIQAELDQIAQPFAGKSDGWGALIED